MYSNLSFYLNFKNDSAGLVQISEPVKFDSANFVIEQDKKRYGRDVFYGNEEVSLEFYKGVYENGLTHEYERLIQYYLDYGFESEVEFIVRRDNVDFVVGLLDYELAETDQVEYFKTKIIQNTTQALVKRREDINVDVFSDVDLDDDPITPITTKKILLKAKPVVESSTWDKKDIEDTTVTQIGTGFTHDLVIPIANQLLNYGIKNSYAPFDIFWGGLDLNINQVRKFIFDNKLLTAKEELTNIKVKVKNLTIYGISTGGRIRLRYGTTFFDENGNFISAGNTPTTSLEDEPLELNIINQDYEFTIPFMNAGESLWFDTNMFFSSNNLTNIFMQYYDFKHDGVEITATSTAVNSVIDGVRHIDYIKQVVKSATGLNVIAPRYDVGGEHYDNFVFNGKLIRQFSDQAFYGTIKDNMEQLQEINSDYQINKENIFIGQYQDFYPNNEIGAFLTAPDDSFKSDFNSRYTVQTIEYKYKSFEQDRDEKNTIDAVHTSSQWMTSNKQVEGNLKVEVPFVRDPFEIESARRQGINTKETTSLSNDDKVYIINVIPLAPSSRDGFTRVLQFQRENATNTLKILSDGGFNWTLLGFGVGDVINVTIGNGLVIAYNVIAIENTLITLQPVSGSVGSDLTDTQALILDYPLTQVMFTNRTNEGFTLIENIQSGDNFSNLLYTIKRNMQYFYPYFKTACKFTPNGRIKNTYFKSNGEATTQYLSGETYKENETILVSELGNSILSPYKYSTTLVADFDNVLNTLIEMQEISGISIGGFIRMMDNNFRVMKVYPTKLDYTWATNELKIEGEELQESEFLEVNKIGNLIYINEVGYEQDILYPITIRTEGDYVQIMDKRGVGLHNKINYNKVVVNSNIFSNIVELSEALLTL
jgi:hypothetical protein